MKTQWILRGLACAVVGLIVSGCESSVVKGTFSSLNSCSSFPLGVEQSTTKPAQTDLLFVVDNSGSMAEEQAELQASFRAFSDEALRPDANGQVRDVRIGVIRTDSYFVGDYTNPNGTLIKYPVENARLLAPGEDGERTADMIRKFYLKPNDFPLPGPRSGRAILSTIPDGGGVGDSAFYTQLNSDFMLNAKPGIAGSALESGLSSFGTFLKYTDGDPSCQGTSKASYCFYRPGSFRVVVFISDEIDNCKGVATCVKGTERVKAVKEAMEQTLALVDGKKYGVDSDARLFSVALVSRSSNYTVVPENDVDYFQFIDALAATTSGNSMGKHSKTLKLGKDSIASVLSSITQTINEYAVTTFSSFTLPSDAASAAQTEFYVVVGGSKTRVPPEKISVSGTSLKVDAEWLKQFPPSAELQGCYYPKN